MWSLLALGLNGPLPLLQTVFSRGQLPGVLYYFSTSHHSTELNILWASQPLHHPVAWKIGVSVYTSTMLIALLYKIL